MKTLLSTAITSEDVSMEIKDILQKGLINKTVLYYYLYCSIYIVRECVETEDELLALSREERESSAL